MNKALVEIYDLAKDIEEVAVQTQWEVENIDDCQFDKLLIQEDPVDELLIQEDSPINYDDIVGYDDGRNYSTDDTYPY